MPGKTIAIQKQNIIISYQPYPKSMYFKQDFIYSFPERGEGREKERERNINVWLPLICPLLGTWPTTLACALTGNRTEDPFGSQAGTQSTEPHQPGPKAIYFLIVEILI